VSAANPSNVPSANILYAHRYRPPLTGSSLAKAVTVTALLAAVLLECPPNAVCECRSPRGSVALHRISFVWDC
jgi:hypothetical protein